MHLSTLKVTSSSVNRDAEPYMAHWAALACGKLVCGFFGKRHCKKKKGVVTNYNFRME